MGLTLVVAISEGDDDEVDQKHNNGEKGCVNADDHDDYDGDGDPRSSSSNNNDK